MSDILVNIFMLTYNQEEYIGQTIESVLGQNANFNYQLIIGEDCSTDSTRSICEKYANENKEKIKLLPSKENLGLINNFIRTFKECNAKYVAICDGDDYWTDHFKLQKQFNFLESNPDYAIVHTNLNFLYPSGKFHLKDTTKLKKDIDFEDLIFENVISSVTAFFRNKQHVEEFPRWISKFPYGDWPIYLWTLKDGDRVGFLEDVTGVYRKEIGVSEKLKNKPSAIAKVNLEIVSCIYEDEQYSNKNHIVKKSLEKHKFALLACYFREKEYFKSLRVASQLVKDYPNKVVQLYAYLIKRKVLDSRE